MADASAPMALVVGGSGAVGRQLVELLPGRGWRVRAVDRPGAWIGRPQESGAVQVLSGDVTSEAFLEEVVPGAEAVVWASDAAEDLEEAFAVNARAAEACYQAARRSGVRVFVYVSCGLVYARTNKPIAEGFRLSPVSPYAKSKLEGERRLRDSLARSGPSLVVLRTGPVFGPGARGIGGLVAAASVLVHRLAGRKIVLRGGPVWSWSHAGDVARAAFHAIRSQALWGETFNVVSGGPVPLGKVVGYALAGYLGRDVRGLPLLVPGPGTFRWMDWLGSGKLASGLGPLFSWLWSLVAGGTGRGFAPSPGLGLWDLLTRNLVLDGQVVERAGLVSEYPDLERAWRRTMRWYVREKWLPDPEPGPDVRSLLAAELEARGRHDSVAGEPDSRSLECHLRLHWSGLQDFLRHSGVPVDGSCFLEGIAEHVSCWGDVKVDPGRQEVTLELRLRLEGSQDGFMRLHGRPSRDLFWKGLELSGTLFGEGGRALRRVSLRLGLPQRLTSILPSVGVARWAPEG